MTPKTAPDPSRDFERASQAAEFVLARAALRPQVAVVLGSGLSSFGEGLSDVKKIAYSDIPHFPRPTVVGHTGMLLLGGCGGVPVAVMQGRVHYYEGYPLREVVFPVRMLARMGVRALVLSSACGGLDARYLPGNLVALRDHINLLGSNPLIGPNDERLGIRFPDMTAVYDARLRAVALEQAQRLGVAMFEGVYAAVTGPSYETPAEIMFLRTIGADLVGMSTVPEAIAARHAGMLVLAIAYVANAAAGMAGPLSHAEVLEVGRAVEQDFARLLTAVLPDIRKIVEA